MAVFRHASGRTWCPRRVRSCPLAGWCGHFWRAGARQARGLARTCVASSLPSNALHAAPPIRVRRRRGPSQRSPVLLAEAGGYTVDAVEPGCRNARCRRAARVGRAVRLGADLPAPRRCPSHAPARGDRGGAGSRSLLRPRRDRAPARPGAPGSVDLLARAGPDSRHADHRRQGAAAALREGRHPRRRPRGAARARRGRQGDAGHRVQRRVQPAPGRPVPGQGRRSLVRVHPVRGDRRAAGVPLLRRAVLQDPVGGRADGAQGRRRGLQHAGRRREAGR